VLQKEEEIRLDTNGCFMRIPETVEDKIIAQKLVDVLLDHNKQFRLGRSQKFWKETRRVGKNKNENVLMVEYEITNKNIIAALREAAERYSDKLGSEYYSPDGFVPNRPKTGEPTEQEITAYTTLVKHFPGLSLSHNNDFSVKELSICSAGLRPCTLTTDVNFEENGTGNAIVDNVDYLREFGVDNVLANGYHKFKVQRDIASLGVDDTLLQFSLDGAALLHITPNQVEGTTDDTTTAVVEPQPIDTLERSTIETHYNTEVVKTGSSTAVTTAVTEPESNSITTITVPAHVYIIAAIPPRPAATGTIGIDPTRMNLTDGFSVSNLVTQITDGITKNLTNSTPNLDAFIKEQGRRTRNATKQR
jgi:hypothetical protein